MHYTPNELEDTWTRCPACVSPLGGPPPKPGADKIVHELGCLLCNDYGTVPSSKARKWIAEHTKSETMRPPK